MAFATVLLLLSLFNQTSVQAAVPQVKTLIIASNRFVKFAGSEKAAQDLIAQEIAVLNASLSRQEAGLGIQTVGFEKLDLQDEFDPKELCDEWEDYQLDSAVTSERFQPVPALRERYHADLVVFMVNCRSGLLAESNSYGNNCRGNREGKSKEEKDASYVFVDRLGLATLTLPHEVGHYLGIPNHNFANPKPGFATLMIANGNRENLKRIPYWSDRTFQLDGRSLLPLNGEADVDVIRANVSSSVTSFERWMHLRKR